MSRRWSIAIHGGAGGKPRGADASGHEQACRAALARALAAGSGVLAARGSALDAVEAAVVVLEDEPWFNAGRGSVLNRDGAVELDAAIMDGRSRDAGAVAGVTRTRNPVRLARAVMVASPHLFLAGRGADEFAREQQLEQVDPDWFATPARREELRRALGRRPANPADELPRGTVGAVALDIAGHLAAATSTGGMTGKRPGRISDSAVIGAGTYADDRAGAVSATGLGESFIRAVAAHAICDRMRLAGAGAQAAADAVIADVATLGGRGGVIVAAPDGGLAWSFDTPLMYRGRASSDGGSRVAVFADEG